MNVSKKRWRTGSGLEISRQGNEEHALRRYRISVSTKLDLKLGGITKEAKDNKD